MFIITVEKKPNIIFIFIDKHALIFLISMLHVLADKKSGFSDSTSSLVTCHFIFFPVLWRILNLLNSCETFFFFWLVMHALTFD